MNNNPIIRCLTCGCEFKSISGSDEPCRGTHLWFYCQNLIISNLIIGGKLSIQPSGQIIIQK